MPIVQIAQHMQTSIWQFLCVGDPYISDITLLGTQHFQVHTTGNYTTAEKDNGEEWGLKKREERGDEN